MAWPSTALAQRASSRYTVGSKPGSMGAGEQRGSATDANGHEREPLLSVAIHSGDKDDRERGRGVGPDTPPEARSPPASPKGGSPWGGNGGGLWSSAIVAEAIYCCVSAGTILFNKHALSTYEFPAPNALLTFQFGIAVVLLKLLSVTGFLQLEPLRWDMVKLWFPVNIVFVFMNMTGFYALMSISAGMFTVLKNLANLLTILGDWYFFGKTYSWQVWACLLLMILSAALGGWSDLSFSWSGYAWQLANCLFTAAYSLCLSSVVRAAAAGEKAAATQLSAVATGGGGSHSGSPVMGGGGSGTGGLLKHLHHTNGSDGHPLLSGAASPSPSAAASSQPMAAAAAAAAQQQQTTAAGRRRLSELSMVYYNNALSVPPLFLLAIVTGELPRLRNYPHFGRIDFSVVVGMGALLGFGVSFASIWCMSRTSATIYSLTGSMNKVVVAVVGIWYFVEPVTPTNLMSIVMGLIAGILFVFAKTAPSNMSVAPQVVPRSGGSSGSSSNGNGGASGGGGGASSGAAGARGRLPSLGDSEAAVGSGGAGGAGGGVQLVGGRTPGLGATRVGGGGGAGGEGVRGERDGLRHRRTWGVEKACSR